MCSINVESVEDICGMLNCFGKTLLCWILSPLLSWKCMPYGVYSVPFLVLCTIRLLHVVPMMLVNLDYCELLFSSLVRIMVCGCNQNIKICGCRIIVGKWFLIL